MTPVSSRAARNAFRHVLAAAAVFTATVPALAEPTPADVLFREGRALMEQGNIAEACQKFAQSLTFARRGGILLNLAVCREKQGLYATAMRLLEEARAVAVKDGRADRAALANEHLRVVRSKLSWLTVRISPEATGLRFTIQRDGETLPTESMGIPEAVDPGLHTVAATVAGHSPFQATVRVGPAGDQQVVEIPPLAPPVVASRPTSFGMRFVGAGAMGLGTSALVAGTVSGIKAIVDSKESQRLCPNNRCPASFDGYQKNQDARAAAVFSDVAIPAGIVAVGASVYLLLRAHTTPAPEAPARVGFVTVAPIGGPRSAGVVLGGLW